MFIEILTKIFAKKNKNDKSFSNLPSKERKKIIKKAVEGANKDQLDLVKRYCEKFSCDDSVLGKYKP